MANSLLGSRYRETEQAVREIAEEDFTEILNRIPAQAWDKSRLIAYRLIRSLNFRFSETVKLTREEVLDGGLSSRFGTVITNGSDSKFDQLIQDVIEMAEEAAPEERLIDPHKPAFKAVSDLAKDFRSALDLWSKWRDQGARTALKAKLPEFLVIGTPRSATTWIYRVLSQHPEVFMPSKELEFFGGPRYYLGPDWYAQHFRGKSDGRVAGDVSPGYFDSHSAPSRISQSLGAANLKLVLLLREPIDRAISYYTYRRNFDLMPRSFEEAVCTRFYRHLFIESGHYYKQYERWLEQFSADRLKVIKYDDIRRDPALVLRDLFDFIEVEPDFVPESTTVVFNKSYQIGHDGFHDLMTHVTARARMIPRLGRRARVLARKIDRTLARKRVAITNPVAIETAIYEGLVSEFTPSNRRLSEVASIDLSEWPSN